MESGKLRHVIRIERPATSVDSYGDVTPGWELFIETRARLSPISGRETFLSEQFSAEVKTKATIRYVPGLDPSMRVVHDDLSYNIIFIQDVEMRHRQINLLLSQGLRE